jgi:hypothetical protein
LIPVTPAEVEFKKIHGLERLEEEFEKNGFNHRDPPRPSAFSAIQQQQKELCATHGVRWVPAPEDCKGSASHATCVRD